MLSRHGYEELHICECRPDRSWLENIEDSNHRYSAQGPAGAIPTTCILLRLTTNSGDNIEGLEGNSDIFADLVL